MKKQNFRSSIAGDVFLGAFTGIGLLFRLTSMGRNQPTMYGIFFGISTSVPMVNFMQR